MFAHTHTHHLCGIYYHDYYDYNYLFIYFKETQVVVQLKEVPGVRTAPLLLTTNPGLVAVFTGCTKEHRQHNMLKWIVTSESVFGGGEWKSWEVVLWGTW